MYENLIIYEDSNSLAKRVWKIATSEAPTFTETLVKFYENCGGRLSKEIFEAAITNMTTCDATEMFNQLVNGTKLVGVYMTCMPTEIYAV